MLFTLLFNAAFAQDIESFVDEFPNLDAQTYRMPIDSRMTLWADDAGVAPDMYASARVVLDYMYGPIGAIQLSNDESLPVLADAFATDIIGGFAYSNLRIGVDLPIFPVTSSGLEEASAGLGDMSIDVKGTFLDPAEEVIGVAISLRFGLPTSTLKVPLGADGLTYEIAGIIDHNFGDRGLLAVNLGYRHAPPVQLLNLDLSDQFTFRVGGGVKTSEEAGVSADLAGRYDYAFNDKAGTPVEALLGGFTRLGESPFMFRGGMGTGLTSGVGSPLFRVLAGVTYEPPRAIDTDGDGYVDGKDGCPLEPEDFDTWEDENGCPDLDNDSDGVVDVEDECPLIAEDLDTWEDENGCPDPLAHVTFKVVDEAGQEVPGANSKLTGRETDHADASSFALDLAPGSYAFSAGVENYNSSVAVEVPAGGELLVVLQLGGEYGLLELAVRNEKGKSLNAEWVSQGSDDSHAVEEGLYRGDMTVGSYQLDVTSEGYNPGQVDVEIELGETTKAEVVLTPRRVSVSRVNIDIDGTIYFNTAQTTIKQESFELLDEIIEVLLEHEELTLVRVEGHTDSRGSAASNQRLSEGRAASVLSYLTKRGVVADRLESEGMGEAHPINSAETQEAWALNRRVEFIILKRSDMDIVPEEAIPVK
jgi:outer membrane protein OmpA-like peptidoglycan-associated protein